MDLGIYKKEKKYMKVNLKMGNSMEQENWGSQIMKYTLVRSMMVNTTVKDSMWSRMVIYIKGSGNMVKNMEWGYVKVFY